MPAARDYIAANTALGRIGLPHDVAEPRLAPTLSIAIKRAFTRTAPL